MALGAGGQGGREARSGGVDEDDERCFSPYPPELPADAVVTEAYALIPLAAAARLDRCESALKLCVPSRDGLARA